MKKLLFACAACVMSIAAVAQNAELAAMVADGKKFYLEFVDVNDKIQVKEAPLVEYLQTHWDQWTRVLSLEEADFILRIDATMSVGFHMTRGAAVKMDFAPSIKMLDGTLMWQGASIRGNAYTVLNAYEKANEALIKESFSKELRQNLEGKTKNKKKK